MNYKHEWRERYPRFLVNALPLPLNQPSAELTAKGYFEGRGLCWQAAKLNGWYLSTQAGDPHLRVVIPATCSDGRLYWQGRLLTESGLVLSPVPVKRYQSPPADRHDALIVVRGNVIGGPWCERANDAVAICEGPFDALAAAETGCVREAVALMGNNPGDLVWGHVKRILENYSVVFLLMDSDAPDATTRWLIKIVSPDRIIFIISSSPLKDFARVGLDARRKILSGKLGNY